MNFNEKKDIYRDVISGFKDGEQRPMFSALMEKVRRGEYQQLLFSEFSRLDRKPSNLLRTLETLQKQNVYCWFNKQSIWVKDKNDIGTQIMIQVLAVLSQYEIELFTARGIDGKITALKTRGTTNGGPSPYGYKHFTKDSKLVIDHTEAEVVRRIFNYYIQDKTPTQIVDILNSEGIPCPFWSRLKDAAEKRKDKGLSPKTYRRGDPDNMRWHANNINRIVKNTVYIGKRHFTFYEPDPLWVLVIVRFVDGSERWGTIKNVRYAKKEVKRDGEYRYTMGFSGWFINNDRHSLSYDRTAHTITEKQTDGKKTYTFEEYDAVVQERKQTDFFEPYIFDVR